MNARRFCALALLAAATSFGQAQERNIAVDAADLGHRIVLIAGEPSHAPGIHEFRAGCLLFKSILDRFPIIADLPPNGVAVPLAPGAIQANLDPMRQW